MKNTFLNIVFSIYLGLICLISGITFCVSLAGIGQDAIVYNFPEMGVYDDYSYYRHPNEAENTKLSAEELSLKKERDIERAQWNALRGIIDSVMTFVISLAVFIFHWRMFKKAQHHN